jgi:16S rRNA (cytosine1407-C5)-methyltransferase
MAPHQTKEDNPLDALRAHLLALYSQQDVDTIFKGFSTKRSTTLRVNTIKTTRDEFEKAAGQLHVILQPVSWCAGAYVLVSPSLRIFSETPLYTQGLCYIQSLSSMLPAIILNPQKGETVLDLCAAPGSKTSQMAAMMENSGEIVANDASHTRIYRLKANLERLGVSNTNIIHSVGQGLWQKYLNYFDKALVDVPCSMIGRIALDDPKTYQHWSIKKVRDLQEKQKYLLRSAVSATKQGGTIVYSTCTLSKKENEDVIDWIIKKENGVVILEETKKIFPSELFEGFYIAKLKKINATNYSQFA